MLNTFEETIHGVPIRDPYRWLEDRSAPETSAWLRKQQHNCDVYFDECPGLRSLELRVRNYLDVTEIDQPAKIGGKYLYRRRGQQQEQGCLCIREAGNERVLVDPSILGKYASVNIYRIAWNGDYLAYELGYGGEDRKEIRIVDLRTGTLLPERIPLGYPRGFAFTSNGFFYCQETDFTNDVHQVRYHTFGSINRDVVVLELPRSRGSRLVLKADAERLGVLWYRTQDSEVLLDFLTASANGPSSWHTVFKEKTLPFLPLLSCGGVFAIVETESKCSQLLQFSEAGEVLRTVVPASEVPIRYVTFTRDCVYVNYLKRGIARIDRWTLLGDRLSSLSFSPHESIQLLPEYGQEAESVFFRMESFDTPSVIFEYGDHPSRPVEWFRRSRPTQSKRLEIEEKSIISVDGTAVPMTLVSASKRTAGDPGPVVMTSYGGFGASMTPRFSVLVTLLIELGATFALPHIRGGGELGRAWHEAGRRRNRQAAIDDFIASAEWLCSTRRTNPELLGIFGGSNGGLLVGAAMTQRPDLFRAVLCIAPLLDMLRYERFDRATEWRREYGTVEDPLDFQALYAYSPYHHVTQSTNYPSTLFVVGDKDDRCNPAHVRKMAEALQDRPAQTSPVIVDYSEERGHAPVLPLSVRVSALARRIAFLCRELHVNVPEGGGHETACL